MSLLDLQKERLCSILSPSKDIFWKVLILDNSTKSIISPILKLNELRSLGVTTYFLLDSSRQQIKDIPAVYFISSTPENIDFIKKDISNSLYSGYYINFSTFIKREELEDLAYYVSKIHMGLHVQSVFDQYIDFISLQNSLFILNTSRCLVEMKLKKDDYVKNISNKLFSLFFTLKEVPFILETKNSEICQEISNLLIKKIKNLGSIQKTRKRPLLIFLERGFDMSVPIEHPWTYNGLVNDLLDFKLNKVTYIPTKKNEEIKKENIQQSFELNDDDKFWKENQFELFPDVSEKIERELLILKKEMAMRSIDDRTDKKIIESILEKAPELARRNESIKAHMNICLEIVERIKQRSIDDFYRLENSRNINEEDIIDISEKGEDNDIHRLVLKKKGEINEEILLTILKKRKIKEDIFKIFKKSNEGVRLSQNMVTSLIGNVKKLLPVSVAPRIFSEIENIYNGVRNGKLFNSDDSNVFFKDPLSNKEHVYDTEISKIVVVVLGTSSYKEFSAIKNLENKLGIEIIYVCDEIVNSEEFLNQFIESNELMKL